MVMGDAVTRTVQPGGHAQDRRHRGLRRYRDARRLPHRPEQAVDHRGATKRPPKIAPATDFKKLFEMNISTDRR